MELKNNHKFKLNRSSKSKKEESHESNKEEVSKGLKKSDFLYMEPKDNSIKEFAQCKTCWKFTGKSCLEFSPNDKVGAEDSCGLYNFGPNHTDMLGKETSGTTKEIAGFVDGSVRCENCEYFEEEDGDCLLFRMLGIKDYKVLPKACCNAWSKKD